MVNNFNFLAMLRGYFNSLIPSLIANYQKEFSGETRSEGLTARYLEIQKEKNEGLGATSYPVVLNIIGPIVKYSTWSYSGTQYFIRLLKKIEQDAKISGVMLNIDSGGGMVSGTAEFAMEIKAFSKPIITYTNGYMCSAAYEIAAACDMRVAHPHADLIGSIGTMMHYQDFSKMFEKWGAVIYELYAPESTEKNIEWRDFVDGNAEKYEAHLSEITKRFINEVKENVPDLKDDGHVFKGKTYTPEEALKIGLIDKIMTKEETLNLL